MVALVTAPVERGEVWGRRQSIGEFRSTDMVLRRVLALTFPAGGIVLFIPWRGGAEARGANKRKTRRLLTNRPCPGFVYQESASKERLRVSNWVDRSPAGSWQRACRKIMIFQSEQFDTDFSAPGVSRAFCWVGDQGE
jgi:hypothetical protein